MNKNILFLENFYTLLNSGYSVEEALSICQIIFNIPYIHEILIKLSQGEDIYELLMNEDFPKLFKEYLLFYKNKNCLSEAIEKSLNLYKTYDSFIKEIKSKITYPLILIMFLFVFSLFIVFVLLPQVHILFDSFQIEKDIVTHILFSLFYYFPFFFIIIFMVFMISTIYLLFGLKYKKYRIIEFFLKVPYINILIKKYFSLRFAIYYYELSLEEMDSSLIIETLNTQMKNNDLKLLLYEINNHLKQGESIENVLNKINYLDPLLITFFHMYFHNPLQKDSIYQYVKITLMQIDYYISQLLKYMIPFIYGFVALFVVSVYVSIIIPLMNVASTI